MADDLDLLYENQSDDSTARPAEPPVVPAPAPAVPNPEIEELRRELYLTKGQLAGLVQQRQIPPPQEITPDAGNWQDKEFLTEGEERLLLESTKPRETLNRMFNTVGKTMHENFAAELRKRDEYLAQVAHGTQQYQVQAQQAQATQHFQGQFYTQYADLKGDEDLVAQAAQSVAIEHGQAPWRFGNADAVLARIAEVTRETKKAKLLRWGGGTSEAAATGGPPASHSPSRRAAMETGGSTRVGLPSPPKDGQVKAIGAMLDHVRGGRR